MEVVLMPRMQLFGGEKDGYGRDGELVIPATSRPDVFYVVPNLDEDKVSRVKSKQAKIELRDKLAVLAYKFDPDESSTDHFKMMRCPELDKVRQT
jgi:hypothetical protein